MIRIEYIPFELILSLIHNWSEFDEQIVLLFTKQISFSTARGRRIDSKRGRHNSQSETRESDPNIWGVIPDIEHQRALQPNHTIVKARYQNQ